MGAFAPPTRATNALVAVLAGATGLAVANAVGQARPYLAGLLAVLAVLVGLRVISPEVTARQVVGGALVFLGGVGSVAVVGVAAARAIAVRPWGEAGIATVVTAAAVAGVGFLWYATLAGLDGSDVRAAGYHWVYALVIVGGTLLAVVVGNLAPLAAEVGLGTAAATALGAGIDAVLFGNGLVRLGTFLVGLSLVGALWHWTRTRTLYRRAGRWLVDRAGDRRSDDREAGGVGRGSHPESRSVDGRADGVGDRNGMGSGPASTTGSGATSENSAGGASQTGSENGSGDGEADADSLVARLGAFAKSNPALAAGVPTSLLGLATLGVGLGANPPGTPLSATLGPSLGGAIAAVTGRDGAWPILGWTIVALVGTALLHAALAWLLHFPWKTYRRRVGRAVVPVAAVAGAFLATPSFLELLRTTPAVHYVPVVEGEAVYPTPEGVETTPVDTEIWTGVGHASPQFRVVLAELIELVGAATPLLFLLAGALACFAVVVLAGLVGGTRPGARIGSPAAIGGGLLFAATALAALLGAGTALVVGATAGVLATWHLTATAADVRAQLGATARTGRGEAVRVLGAGGIAVVCAGGALTFARVADVVRAAMAARPESQAIALSVLAALACLVGLLLLRRAE